MDRLHLKYAAAKIARDAHGRLREELTTEEIWRLWCMVEGAPLDEKAEVLREALVRAAAESGDLEGKPVVPAKAVMPHGSSTIEIVAMRRNLDAADNIVRREVRWRYVEEQGSRALAAGRAEGAADPITRSHKRSKAMLWLIAEELVSKREDSCPVTRTGLAEWLAPELKRWRAKQKATIKKLKESADRASGVLRNVDKQAAVKRMAKAAEHRDHDDAKAGKQLPSASTRALQILKDNGFVINDGAALDDQKNEETQSYGTALRKKISKTRKKEEE